MKQSARSRSGRIVLDLMLGLFVVLLMFGFASWGHQAKAAVGHAPDRIMQIEAATDSQPNVAPFRVARLSEPDARSATIKPKALIVPDPAFAAPRHSLTDLPPDVAIPPLQPDETSLAAGYAIEEDILFRYAGATSHQMASFVAAQKTRRDTLTGRPQFLLLALVFAVMSAVTLGLWRQMTGAVANGARSRRRGNRPVRSVHRLC